MRYWQAGILAAFVWVAADGARAQFRDVTDCAKLQIRLTGIPEAGGARCDGDENAYDETIDASGPGSIFVIRHQSTIERTYFWRLKAAEIVDRLTASAQVESRSEEFEVEDFNVMRYRATPSGKDSPSACFAFVRYAGHVAHTTGYRHSVVGFYCDLTGNAPTDARIGELLGAIDADFW